MAKYEPTVWQYGDMISADGLNHLEQGVANIDAEGVSFASENMHSQNVQDAINELFTSVSEGKDLIASAITDKGVSTEADASFHTMHENILSIPTGGGLPAGLRTISVAPSDPAYGSVSGGGMAQDGMTVTVSAEALHGATFDGWQEDENIVFEETEYPFVVDQDRTLTAMFTESTLGRVWHSTSMPSSGQWLGTSYGNGVFVALGLLRAAYSTNGTTWTATSIPYNSNWQGVVYGDGKFVAVSYNQNKSVYSTDGITWTAGGNLPSTAYWQSVAYGNGKFVTVAGGGSAAYSTDGNSWESSSLPSGANWFSVAYGDGKFIAVAPSTNQAAYSEDGVAWEAVNLPFSASWYGVAYGNDKFVAVAHLSNQAAYSEDGITWTPVSLPSSAGAFTVAFGDGEFIAVATSSNHATYSYDGITWKPAVMPVSQSWRSIAVGGGRSVAVPFSGDQAAYSV